MSSYICRRLLQSLGSVLAMSIVAFTCVYVIGDPIDILINPEATAAERQQAVVALGLDRPVWVQYWTFISHALRGDLGQSFVFNEPALTLILQRLPATLELAVGALLISLLLGIPLGILAGSRPESLLARAIQAACVLGLSLPGFWFGLVLIMVFAVYLGWLPSGGRGETGTVFGIHTSFASADGLRHLLLPALNLAVFKLSVVTRLTASSLTEVLASDYIEFARAKGLRPLRILCVHALKSAMTPVITVVGLELGSLIAFAVVTETVFSWPGIGKLIIDSIMALDRPVIVAYLLFVVVLFLTINLAVDILHSALDPRAQLAARE